MEGVNKGIDLGFGLDADIERRDSGRKNAGEPLTGAGVK